MNSLYIMSYGLKFYTVMMVYYNLNKIEKPDFWKSISNDTNTQKKAYNTFYWLNAGP